MTRTSMVVSTELKHVNTRVSINVQQEWLTNLAHLTLAALHTSGGVSLLFLVAS